ncbi:MAG: AlpA family phage regulatory protein [Silicimonas sp.]|jgi:prophage regulatory protein|uniref:helix-turn-helix transcriptional regulator n=1 Tax=Roseovarius sp. TaxID=1486281 RepID=UPI0032EEB801
MTNTSPENLYLSVDQVAQRFNVSKDTIWRWKRHGEFPKPVKLGGTTTRWRLAEIEAWEGQLACGLVTCLDVGAYALRGS